MIEQLKAGINAALLMVCLAAPQAALAQENSISAHDFGTTSDTTRFIAQTLEIRDSGVPAKTVDESGLKLKDDILAPPAEPTVLKGALTKEELTASVSINADGKSLTLQLVNRGKRALIFSGSQARVLSGEAQIDMKTAYEILPPPRKSEIVRDIGGVLVSLASDGAVPTAYDFATTYQNGMPFYGKDQNRRKLAETRFSERTVFPGETSTGVLYLKDNCPTPAQVSIPVTVHPTGESLGNLILPIDKSKKTLY